ncbi:hypothetical protein [Gordonia soli]|uniref:Uncharacterized protein n=1 Tax=Gordonia soli NBRC 108243 TaxID=1223545 RepID=M0QJF0_9ACTN|nr:hypothetical protein [Gordonia soli]GAC67562.1 hypothetical protein GS4_08_01470 [Gordonia soli NBRC 108243]
MSLDGSRRAAQAFSRGLTILGSVILIACVTVLIVSWWQDSRWVWVGIGIAVIVVNVVLVVLQIRKRPAPVSGDSPE